MKSLFTAVLVICFFTAPAFAGFDDTINEITAPIASAVGSFGLFQDPGLWSATPARCSLVGGRCCLFHLLLGLRKTSGASNMPSNWSEVTMQIPTALVRFHIFRRWRPPFPARLVLVTLVVWQLLLPSVVRALHSG